MFSTTIESDLYVFTSTQIFLSAIRNQIVALFLTLQRDFMTFFVEKMQLSLFHSEVLST
jgi:hypothetical protein